MPLAIISRVHGPQQGLLDPALGEPVTNPAAERVDQIFPASTWLRTHSAPVRVLWVGTICRPQRYIRCGESPPMQRINRGSIASASTIVR